MNNLKRSSSHPQAFSPMFALVAGLVCGAMIMVQVTMFVVFLVTVVF